MDDRGPRKPAQLDKKRFDLEWHLPLEPGLPTHAALYDLQPTLPELIAESEGGDEAETLLSLWTTLSDRGASADAIAYVADAYTRRTGRQPERTGSVDQWQTRPGLPRPERCASGRLRRPYSPHASPSLLFS